MFRASTAILAALLLVPSVLSAEVVDYAETFIMEQNEGPVQYASGGVGINEREAMRAMADNYNLQLSFAAAGGAYLAHVMVVIKDTDGNVLIHTTSNGPWFFANLPQENYQIMVAHDQIKRMKDITLTGASQKIVFYWK